MLRLLSAALLLIAALTVGCFGDEGRDGRDALLEGAEFQVQVDGTATPVESFAELEAATPLEVVLPSEAPDGMRLARVWALLPPARVDAGIVSPGHQWWLTFEGLVGPDERGFMVQEIPGHTDIGDPSRPIDINGIEGLFSEPNDEARTLVWYGCDRTFILGYRAEHFSLDEAREVAGGYIEACQ